MEFVNTWKPSWEWGSKEMTLPLLNLLSATHSLYSVYSLPSQPSQNSLLLMRLSVTSKWVTSDLTFETLPLPLIFLLINSRPFELAPKLSSQSLDWLYPKSSPTYTCPSFILPFSHILYLSSMNSNEILPPKSFSRFHHT